jgi:hypothetical protein
MSIKSQKTCQARRLVSRRAAVPRRARPSVHAGSAGLGDRVWVRNPVFTPRVSSQDVSELAPATSVTSISYASFEDTTSSSGTQVTSLAEEVARLQALRDSLAAADSAAERVRWPACTHRQQKHHQHRHHCTECTCARLLCMQSLRSWLWFAHTLTSSSCNRRPGVMFEPFHFCPITLRPCPM